MHYTLCDLFSDLTQNAIEAGSSKVTVSLVESDGTISLEIADDGKGMTEDQLKRATDPFYTDGVKHPGRKIGLGIPFLIQTAETTGGTWKIRSAPAGGDAPHGTVVTCSFDLANIDTPPVGDVTGYFRQILTFEGRYELTITHSANRGGRAFEYSVRRSELLEALGLEAFGLGESGAYPDAASLALIGRYLESLMEE